jgi:Zn-dependent protease with chaperone function
VADPTRPRRGHVEPLWDRIDSNRFKTGAFLVLFVLGAGLSAAVFVGAIGFLVGAGLLAHAEIGPFFHALPYLTLGALALGMLIAVLYVARALVEPEQRLPHLFGAVRSEVGTMLETKSALHDMALASGFEHSPPLWVIEDCQRINAFAIGLKDEDTVVGVTRGFADRLSTDEQRAVFANLMARVVSGDAMSATVISAIMGPIWANRATQLRRDETSDPDALTARAASETAYMGDGQSAGVVAQFLLGFLAVVLTELLMFGHERAARAVAEKGDAEGMLLLKDPQTMIDALTNVLNATNTVPGAGEAYSMLFYCWAGFGFAPEDDPEMERIGRLREVLGVQGAVV